MTPPYYGLEELIDDFVDEPNRSVCRRLMADTAELFEIAAGSSFNHQAWQGGYRDHITETMNMALRYYRDWESWGRLSLLPESQRFTLSDAVVVMFWHDIEKLWRWRIEDGQLVIVAGRVQTAPGLDSKAERQAFAATKIAEYDVRLTPTMHNALKYVECIRDADYTPYKLLMEPLAVICHMADLTSARGFHDFPRARDPWVEASAP